MSHYTKDFIRVIDEAIPQSLCEQLINTFERSQHLTPGRTGGGVNEAMKKSTDVSISRHQEFQQLNQQVLQHTTQHIFEYFKDFHFALIGPIALTMADPTTKAPVALTDENFETLGAPKLPALVEHLFRLGDINAQRYTAGEGGYPYWHSENYPQQGSVEPLHRNLLFMFYLNDVEEGGETEFYYQKEKIKPKAGRMVIAPSGFTHTHRGNVPVSNDKYILTSWVLFNPAERIFNLKR